MKPGSKEHKAQFCEELIKDYYENIWTDEMGIISLEGQKGDKKKEIAEIEAKLERKEFKTANEGNKAKFVAERELVHLEQDIEKKFQKLETWHAQIKFIKEYSKKKIE